MSEILEGYGVRPRDLRLLHRYWERMKMVAQAGGYYGESFHRERDVTQGYPLSPTIINVVVDAVVRHWESMARWNGRGGKSAMMKETLCRRRVGKYGSERTADSGRTRDMKGLWRRLYYSMRTMGWWVP